MTKSCVLTALLLLLLACATATVQADNVRGRLFKLNPASLLSAQQAAGDSEEALFGAWEAEELGAVLGPEVWADARATPPEDAAAPDFTPAGSTRRAQLQMARTVDQLKAAQTQCVVCTLAVSLLEQYAWETRQPLAKAANSLCSALTVQIPSLAGVCQLLVGGAVQKLQNDFDKEVSPDISCRVTLSMCDRPTCRLFPQWPPPPPQGAAHAEERLGFRADDGVQARMAKMAAAVGQFANVHAISEEALREKAEQLLEANRGRRVLRDSNEKWIPRPIPDMDEDGYSGGMGYRGNRWRGEDCNDADPNVYPGRNAMQGEFDAHTDSNCNGISGVDQQSGVPWEAALCGQTPARGLLAVGDSATAHFALPPSFITPSEIDMHTYEELIELALTEIDWPHCSWSTGFGNSTVCPESRLPVNSIYQRMRERNRCMHRDFVNQGVNGQSVENLIDDESLISGNYSGALLAIPPRFKVDGPSTVFFSLIGNDICRAKRWDAWTPVDTFARKALAELRFLDTRLAKGSKVIIMGLVDGRVLFDTLKDQRHPIGSTYSQFYDFMNCLEISPCWGWMNTNQTIRDASTARAQEYNQIYQGIIQNNHFENFDLHYYYPDYAALVRKWTEAGYSANELIEPVDGFHPSQTGHQLLAEHYFEWLSQNVPGALGPINPNNAEIIRLFGEQGGHGL